MRFGILVLAVIMISGFIFWKDITGLVVKGQHTENAQQGKKQDKKGKRQLSPDVDIAEKWDLPSTLKEVSGIVYIDNQRFACIQDEAGTIYIYNQAANKIEKEIPFAGPGDFEDLALVGNTAWALRADGKLYEVDMKATKQSAKEYSTSLTVEDNVEGLAYDQVNNRLLLAVKDEEPADKSYKGIYAFDLNSKTFVKEPAYRIDLDHKVFDKSAGEKKSKQIRPSGIGIHPVTKEVYVTDGPNKRLLIMDNSGNIKSLLELGKDFEQAEGITFSPQGNVYISNEGNKQPANILQVQIK